MKLKMDVSLCEVECNYLNFIECGFFFYEIESKFNILCKTRTHNTHHGPDLGEATTFPLIVFFMLGHGANTKCHFVPGLPNESPEIPKIETLTTLEAHNFVCRLPIEMKSKPMF
jgi:hypothetical protein